MRGAFRVCVLASLAACARAQAPAAPVAIPPLSPALHLAEVPADDTKQRFAADPVVLEEMRRIARQDDAEWARGLPYNPRPFLEAAEQLAVSAGERRVVETFLAIYSDPKTPPKARERFVALVVLHHYVDPAQGGEHAMACETALIANEPAYAGAVLDAAEAPGADRELGPLAACIHEKLGLFGRVRELARPHPDSGLRTSLVHSLALTQPRPAKVAALLRELAEDGSAGSGAALEGLTRIEEAEPRASCAVLARATRKLTHDLEEATFLAPKGKCAPFFDEYVDAQEGVFWPPLEARIAERCGAHGVTQASREIYARALVRSLDDAVPYGDDTRIAQLACKCSPASPKRSASRSIGMT